jgi:hypothetical protein
MMLLIKTALYIVTVVTLVPYYVALWALYHALYPWRAGREWSAKHVMDYHVMSARGFLMILKVSTGEQYDAAAQNAGEQLGHAIKWSVRARACLSCAMRRVGIERELTESLAEVWIQAGQAVGEDVTTYQHRL